MLIESWKDPGRFRTIIIGLFAVSAYVYLIRPLFAGTLASLQPLFGSLNWTLLINKDSSFAAKLVCACVSVHASLSHSNKTASFVLLDRRYVTTLLRILQKNIEKIFSGLTLKEK